MKTTCAVLLLAVTTALAQFTPLTPLPAPRVAASATAYPGGSYEAAQLIDGNTKTEYSSDGKGTDTFVEFEFDAPTRIGAFRHVDRNDPATIAASELIFSDASGGAVATVPVTHVNQRGGETFFMLPSPVTAQRVRWRVTKLGQNHRTVGGAEMAFYSAGPAEASPSRDTIEVRQVPVLRNTATGPEQELRVTVHHPYAEPTDALLRLGADKPVTMRLTPGRKVVTMTVPAVATETLVALSLEVAGRSVVKTELRRQPVRPLTVYVLPHSHTDIGYTEIQTEIEDKQVQNLVSGMAIARRTASYPPGARFVWNVEVLWAADLYLRRLGEAQRKEFLEAVKSGQVALNGMYLNELTGLCRPEELIRLFRKATQLGAQTGVPVESAMISDVPGYTWGTVSALAQAGIKYFSAAPNYFDRIGDILVQWENKPFYWVAPDGQSKVLVWIPFWGYAMSHRYHKMSPQLVEDFCDGLAQRGYPYDIAYVRWAGHGDNATPDPAICDFIKDWNATHVSPQFVISSTTEAFRAFELRHGDKLPRVSGDWTPYWEDGAGSSALETALNRASSDRVTQAAALWAMLNPRGHPAAAFEDAWRNVLLYSEHTWGAWCSISEPSRRDTREQWTIKQSYAVAADLQSRDLLSRGLAQSAGPAQTDAIDVFNTTSWPRRELVSVPKFLSEGKDRVTDAAGQPVASQRLRGGELVVLADGVPPFAARRYTLGAGQGHVEGKVTAQGAVLDNGILKVRVDEQTGGIVELRLAGLDANLADTDDGQALNEYLYFNGENPSDAKRNGPVKISVGERGPLVASLLIESDAPGCHRLVRELRLVAGQDTVEIINTLDKDRLVAASYHAKEGKESLNFGFPFAVPEGQVRLEVPFGVIRPDDDQIPSACKNWFTVGRWADVANEHYGITWVTLDAPLVQVGGLTANLLNSQSNPAAWRKKVGRTQKLYSWAMNNHWGTNYRAYQEGPHVFRFILRPHRGHDPLASSRLAIAASQPLLPVGARGAKPASASRLQLSSPDVLVTGIEPSDDGRALMVRLWGAAGREARTDLVWSQPKPKQLWLSDTSQQPMRKLKGPVTVPAWGVVTVRAELGK
jgi:alpha-mannosidase